ncbi:MAG: hypothetical protein ACREMX_13615 [Gemmatimonadales bacterium]
MDAVHILLHGSIDYAGLFPPAGLDMASAVRNYAEYHEGPDAWALGRFVVPMARLGEFDAARSDLLPAQRSSVPWRLAVLVSAAPLEELRALGEFNSRRTAGDTPAASAEVVEVRAESVEAMQRLMPIMPRYLQAYLEIPIDRDPGELVRAIARLGARAKVRTGGVTPEAFPKASDLVRFLRACSAAGVPFKATAGLHHPLRDGYRLTYAPDSPTATMFGFLNLFLAAGFVRTGMADADLARLLEDGSVEAFRFGSDGVSWQGRQLDREALRRTRQDGIISFGSCSFTEPIADLRSLGLL